MGLPVRTTALRSRPSTAVLGAVCAAALAASVTAPAVAAPAHGGTWTRAGVLDPGLAAVGSAAQEVIVTAQGGVAAAAAAVRAVGGTIEERLGLVGGVSASVPGDRLTELAEIDGVVAVTADREGRFETITYDETGTASSFARTTGATAAWAQGKLGEGVGVAVLDTGVSQMKDFEGRLVHGPDLSGEGRLVDTYGHGTVMAGAAAGSGADSAGNPGGAYTGVAPKAHVVAVKVAGANGVVDVSTVLQGMHWVSAYKDQYNIRVLNLSWGTTSTQDPASDPLNYAVQRLWKQGIVVVVSAGNSGPTSGTISKPADDPMVLTVGAYDDKGSTDLADDALAAWSSRGPTAQGLAKPDVVAPGRTLVVARSFGSTVEKTYPKALISPSYIRGSGTSQAAAVVSGVAAVLLSARPELTPDQVKAVLKGTANPIVGKTVTEQGAGRVNLAAALTANPGPATWQTSTASGLGSLEGSRGGRNVQTDCNNDGIAEVVKGEIDYRCQPWNGVSWTGSTWNGDAWTGVSWTGSTWNGSTWNGVSWTGSTWNGSTWNGGTWNGSTWNGSTWNGSTWNGSTWNGSTWNGSTWNGVSWTGSTWNGNDFTSAAYDDVEFATAFWGPRVPLGRSLPGEKSETAAAAAVFGKLAE